MNWGRKHVGRSITLFNTNGTTREVDATRIRHTWTEVLIDAPYSTECRDIIDANKLTLQFYRQACRLIPAFVQRQGNHVQCDFHKSKLNLAKWIRKGANNTNYQEISGTIAWAYDVLMNCAYCEYEAGYYRKYLCEDPERIDGGRFTGVNQSRALNLIDHNRFHDKSKFLKSFIKGTKPLMH